METTGSKKRKIVGRLLEQIRSGAFPEGKRIPSEYDLAEQFQVHKMTANAAVEELVVRGYLERRERGGGTVVRPEAILASSSAVSLYHRATWLSSSPYNLSSRRRTSSQ